MRIILDKINCSDFKANVYSLRNQWPRHGSFQANQKRYAPATARCTGRRPCWSACVNDSGYCSTNTFITSFAIIHFDSWVSNLKKMWGWIYQVHVILQPVVVPVIDGKKKSRLSSSASTSFSILIILCESPNFRRIIYETILQQYLPVGVEANMPNGLAEGASSCHHHSKPQPRWNIRAALSSP